MISSMVVPFLRAERAFRAVKVACPVSPGRRRQS
jgi:hypothetical protein